MAKGAVPWSEPDAGGVDGSGQRVEHAHAAAAVELEQAGDDKRVHEALPVALAMTASMPLIRS